MSEYKLILYSNEQSKKVQYHAFDLGYTWGNFGGTFVKKFPYPYPIHLLLRENKLLFYEGHGPYDIWWFSQYPCLEITSEDFLSLILKDKIKV